MYVDYHLGLAITYGALFLFELVQLGRIIYFRHKFRSFTVAFLTLCFFWAFLRGIFFAFIVDNRWDAADNWIYSIIYWTPINIQFATFSLLVAYYAHLEHKQKGEWRIFKRRYTLIYGISNLLFFGFECVLIILGIIYDDGATEPLWLTNIHKIFSSIVFFILMCINGFYGFHISSTLAQKGSVVQTKLLARLSFKKIVTVSVSLFLIFTFRCIYEFTSVLSVKSNFDIGQGKEYITFLMFYIFEIIPTILVLVLFGQIRSTRLGALSNKPSGIRSANYVRVTNGVKVSAGQLVRADIFNDPRRYDSDEETPLRSSSTTPVIGSFNYDIGTPNSSFYGSTTPTPSGINGDVLT